MENDMYLILSNQYDFKVSSHLGHFLFDFNDGRVRTY
jgi:hypothetical protein